MTKDLKLLWLCTKAKPYLTRIWKNQFELTTSKEIVEQDALNGKILAESDFGCEEIIHTYENKGATYHHFDTKTLDNEQLLRRSHIIGQSIDEYLGNRQYDKNNNVVGYAIHIKNLKVFKKPKALSDYYKTFERTIYRPNEYSPNESLTATPSNEIYFMDCCDVLTKAPQNMMYVYDKDGVKYALISVRPEWLAIILNGLKTIEVRKKVLKEML